MQNPLQVFANAFESRTRDNGSTFWTTRDHAPDWVTDIVRDAHAGAMPCDWRYEKIADIAHELGQVADPDNIDAMQWADRAVDTYTSGLLKWLADVTYALESVDEAATTWGMDTRGVLEMIMAGQCYMLNEMAGRILTDLSKRFAEYLQHEAEFTGADVDA